MNVSLHEMPMNCYVASYSGKKGVELSGETVVSDKMPDIGLLGETAAQVLLRTKRVSHGMGMMEGELYAAIGYIPDGAAGLYKIELKLPWQVCFEAEGITDGDIAVGDVQIAELETRMLNPRKVLVKAKLVASLSCYGKITVSVCDGVECDRQRLQVRQNTQRVSVPASVCEKSFAVTDECTFGDALRGCEVLCRTVSFRVDDVKTLGNKLIVKGCAITEAVVTTQTGMAERLSFNSGFSFIAETDCEAVSSDVQAVILPSAVFLDVNADGSLLTLEIHGVCQMVAYETKELVYVADLYSNFHELEAETCCHAVYDSVTTERRRCTETVSIPFRGQEPRILFSTGHCRRQEHSVVVGLSVCVEYESGAVDWLKKEIAVDISLKAHEALLGACIAALHCGVGEGELELRVTVETDVWKAVPHELRWISAVEVGEPLQRAEEISLIVLRTKGTLWELAKEYGSTVPLISDCNGLTEDALTDETLLLIPKQYL